MNKYKTTRSCLCSLLFLSVLLLVMSCNGQPGSIVSHRSATVNDNSAFKDSSVITSVAGDGEFSGLNQPTGVAIDTLGNIYISDCNNSRILKLTKSTGRLSTFAGDGKRGFIGDGGPATAAEFWFTEGIALDKEGNLYVVDYDNNRVRKINTNTGIISTIAGNSPPHEFGDYFGDGGQATLAKFNHPTGVAVDSKGNIFIVDQYNYRIRKITASTGIITTIAGNGENGYSGDGGLATQAKLFNPWGITTDASGDVFITDELNNCVRKITMSTGIINTVAGNGQYGYAGDGGQATSAELYDPMGVTVDASGNIYVIEYGNSCLRKVTKSTGIINTMAGTGGPGYSGDNGLARLANLRNPTALTLDKDGNIYIADGYNYRIRKITITGNK